MIFLLLALASTPAPPRPRFRRGVTLCWRDWSPVPQDYKPATYGGY